MGNTITEEKKTQETIKGFVYTKDTTLLELVESIYQAGKMMADSEGFDRGKAQGDKEGFDRGHTAGFLSGYDRGCECRHKAHRQDEVEEAEVAYERGQLDE